MARILVAAMAALLVMGLGVAPSQAQKAYIGNGQDGTVSVINTVTSAVIGSPITLPAGSTPAGVAVSPDGSKVYLTNEISGTVSVIATATNTVVGSPITVGPQPVGVAVSPDGSTVYVANEGANFVSVITTATNAVTAITVGARPTGVAVAPNGTVYVANFMDNTVSVISNGAVIKTITGLGNDPAGVAVSPDGNTVYVTNHFDGTVSVIQTSDNTVVGSAIAVGPSPQAVAVTPDGSKVYVVNNNSGGAGTVSVIQTSNNTVIGTPIAVGTNAFSVAVTPDSSKVYVANEGDNTVSVIATANDAVTSIGVGHAPLSFGNFIGPATLTVAEPGTGSGQVTSAPAGIACGIGSQCATMFPDGTQVTLTASASVGSVFAGWSGGVCSGTSTCVITPTVDTTVTATFNTVPSFMLLVATSGSGAGTVSSNPTGITCIGGAGTCSASFAQGAQVALTATAPPNTTFAGWSGGGCSGIISPCVLTLNANTTVTANFVADSAGNLTLVAAVLPTSRSVQIGNTATAFATIIDAGPADASTCTIAPASGIPASFLFQTTSVATNGLIGTANTPVNIAAGQAQSFVIALTPTAAFAPTNVTFTFTCANAPSPVTSITGVNTLNLSGSATPVSDVVALAASGDPGYVDLAPAGPTAGTGAFAVATINLGVAGTITAAANTGTASLPVTLTVCQTNPATGACMAAPAPSVATTIPPNTTPTFGIFAAASATIPDLPGVNRVFVTFTDSGGTLRGETSVAVRTH